METKHTPRIPGPDHPITIERALARVIVRAGTHIIADTREALTMLECDYDPVHYIPLEDVNASLLVRTDHSSYCPYKGDCSYYSLVIDGSRKENVVWTYEQPYDAVAKIKGHVAFYPDQVTIEIS